MEQSEGTLTALKTYMTELERAEGKVSGKIVESPVESGRGRRPGRRPRPRRSR